MKTITTNSFKISYISHNFKEWFGTPEIELTNCELHSVVLSKPMTDREIFNTYNPTEVTLGEMLFTLQSLSHSDWYIFYIKDSAGVLRAVCVHWSGDGWLVGAHSVEGPSEWDDGCRVFSHNPMTLSPSDSLPTTLTINGIEYVKK